MVQFKLAKHKFLNKITLYVQLSGFKITLSDVIHNMLAHQLSLYYQPH